MHKADEREEELHEERAKKAKETLDGNAIERTCNLFKMLSEPSRMKIVLALMQGELCVYHIVEAVGGTQSAVSHQLRILKDGGVIKARRDGQTVVYSIADGHIYGMVELGKSHAFCKE